MKYIIREILTILFILTVVFFAGFHTGRLHQKQYFTNELWQKCIFMKNSNTQAIRTGELWLSYQGAIPKSECGKLFTQDFCVIEKFE
jgi:hypothetical protein